MMINKILRNFLVGVCVIINWILNSVTWRTEGDTNFDIADSYRGESLR